MPADNGFRLYDREGLQNTRRDPIQADEDHTIEVAEDRALRRPSMQHIQLMAQSEYLCLERRLRAKQPEEHPPDQVEQVTHRTFITRFGPSRRADGIYDSDNYNDARTHLSLAKDSPFTRPVQRVGSILPQSVLGGLHHHYVRL
jgi:hypothetical protein